MRNFSHPGEKKFSRWREKILTYKKRVRTFSHLCKSIENKYAYLHLLTYRLGVIMFYIDFSMKYYPFKYSDFSSLVFSSQSTGILKKRPQLIDRFLFYR